MADRLDTDYYALLGIPPTADIRQITTAYRQAALRCHPDKNPGPEAAVQFDRLTAAYRLLSDSSARAAFDRVRSVREAQRQRQAALSAERQAMRRDLLEKEEAWRRQRETQERAEAERQLQAELDRLAAEAAVKERAERRRRGESLFSDEQLSVRFTLLSADVPDPSLTLIRAIPGVKSVQTVSRDGRTGTLVFSDIASARRALSTDRPDVVMEWLAGAEPSALEAIDRVTERADKRVEEAVSEEHLEQLTLLRLRQFPR